MMCGMCTVSVGVCWWLRAVWWVVYGIVVCGVWCAMHCMVWVVWCVMYVVGCSTFFAVVVYCGVLSLCMPGCLSFVLCWLLFDGCQLLRYACYMGCYICCC